MVNFELEQSELGEFPIFPQEELLRASRRKLFSPVYDIKTKKQEA